MPIISSQNEPEMGFDSIQAIYRLWKGEEKQFTKDGRRTTGKDLCDKFRFSSSDSIRQKFESFYGSCYPKEVRIYLPHPTVDQNFPTWMEAYTAQGFKHRCNGQRIVEEKVRISYEVKSKNRCETKYRFEKQACDKPCKKEDLGVCPDCGYKGVGRLSFYVRELYGSGLGSTRGGLLAVSNISDVKGSFIKQLQSLERRYGRLDASPFPYPETLGFIPYVLSRVETPVMKPVGEHQVPGTTWALSISEDPQWLMALQRFQQAKAIIELQMTNPEALAAIMPNLEIAGQPRLITPAPATGNYRLTIYANIDSQKRRIGWTEDDESRHLMANYSRLGYQDLDDLQLKEYLEYLKFAIAAPVDGEFVDADPVTPPVVTPSVVKRVIPSPSAPPPAPQSEGKPSSPMVTRFNAILEITGQSWADVGSAIADLFHRNAKENPLTREEADALMTEMLIRRAAADGYDRVSATELLETMFQTSESGSDKDVCEAFTRALKVFPDLRKLPSVVPPNPNLPPECMEVFEALKITPTQSLGSTPDEILVRWAVNVEGAFTTIRKAEIAYQKFLADAQDLSSRDRVLAWTVEVQAKMLSS